MVGRYWKDHVSGSVADYVRVVEEAKARGLPVLLGLEMDWLPGKGEELRAFLAPYDWDIVLGSVHYVGAFGIDDHAVHVRVGEARRGGGVVGVRRADAGAGGVGAGGRADAPGRGEEVRAPAGGRDAAARGDRRRARRDRRRRSS